jgi:predicted ATPase
MILTSVKAKGYRTLSDVDWSIGALNILIGPNGTGKSNLLSFVALVAESAKGNLEQSVYAAGGMSSLVFDGKENSIEISISMTDEPNSAAEVQLEYFLEMRRLGSGPGYVVFFESETDKEVDSNVWEINRRIERRNNNIKIKASNQHMVDKVIASQEPTETILSSPFLDVSILSVLKEEIASWAIYASIRTDATSEVRQPAVARRADQLDEDCGNLVAVLHTHYSGDPDFKERIDTAMYAAFGDAYKELSFPARSGTAGSASNSMVVTQAACGRCDLV